MNPNSGFLPGQWRRILGLCLVWSVLSVFLISWVDAAPSDRLGSQPANAPPFLVPSAMGPLHEAFAAPLPAHGPRKLVMVAPPPPPNELIPTRRPQGNPIWIPGYWFWDEITLSYVWVGGIWRFPPEGRTWVPGFWKSSGVGATWYPGYWAGPTPGATPGEEPIHPPTKPPLDPHDPGKPPDPDRVSHPGYWAWNGFQHYWQPGTWTKMSPGFHWIPPHNVPVPTGVRTVSGYWDYVPRIRGVASVPSRMVRPHPGESPQPVQPVLFWRTTKTMEAMFVHEPATHYLVGDYYGPQLFRFGISSGLDYARHKSDPIFSVERALNRQDNTWEGKAIKRQIDIQTGKAPRPNHRVPEFVLQESGNGVASGSDSDLVAPYEQAVAEVGLVLVPVGKAEQEQILAERDRIIALAQKRPSQVPIPQNILGGPLAVKRIETIPGNRLPGMEPLAQNPGKGNSQPGAGQISGGLTPSSQGQAGSAFPFSPGKQRLEAANIKDLSGIPYNPAKNPLLEDRKLKPILLPAGKKTTNANK